MSAFCYPYNTVIASVPFNTQHGLFVPGLLDDENTWRYSFKHPRPGTGRRGGWQEPAPARLFEFGAAEVGRNGIIPRR